MTWFFFKSLPVHFFLESLQVKMITKSKHLGTAVVVLFTGWVLLLSRSPIQQHYHSTEEHQTNDSNQKMHQYNSQKEDQKPSCC